MNTSLAALVSLTVVILVSTFPTAADVMSAIPFSVNDFLANSARTDLIGPEMWSSTNGPIPDNNMPDGDDTYYMTAQVPVYGWEPPCFGFHGRWHITHTTPLRDIVRVRIDLAGNGREESLTFTPSRNIWTPGGMTTWYRSRPSGRPGDYPKAGCLAVKERKCITTDNIFIAEMTLANDHREPRTYRVGVLTPDLPDDTSSGSGCVVVDTQARAGGLGDKGPIPIRGSGVVLTTRGDRSFTIVMGPYETITFRYAFGYDENGAAEAMKRTAAALDDNMIFERTAAYIDEWFASSVPRFATGDLDILKVYYYRWFVVYRAYHDNRRVASAHPYPRPAFYESPTGGWYGCVIGLPVPCHLQEIRWLRDGVPGWNDILNWSDGVQGYRGYIQYTPMAVWQFMKSHPDRAKLTVVYDSMKDYANEEYEPGTLPIQRGSWTTGAEYQPNFYQFTEPPWDFRNDTQFAGRDGFELTTLVRLDKVSHAIADMTGSSRMASFLGMTDDATELASGAEAMLDIVRERLWDGRTGMFYSAEPGTWRLADEAPCYDSFTPFMWGMVHEEQYLKAFEKFFDPAWFWSEFPIRTVSQTCPMYWSGNMLTGPQAASTGEPHPYGCTWNGPTWHYANGLMAEALGSAAGIEPDLRDGWLEFMDRWTDLHFLYGDRTVPCAREHHRPTDGARFAGTNDYFHSAWVDPFMRYWAGIDVLDDMRTVRFDPYTGEQFDISGVPVLGRELRFVQERNGSGRLVKRVTDPRLGYVLASGTAGPVVFTLEPVDGK